MICHLCSATNSFLASYASGGELASVTTVITPSATDSNVDIEGVDSAAASASGSSCNNSNDASRKRKLDDGDRKKNECLMLRGKKSKPDKSEDSESSSSSSSSSALFFAEGWRSMLCSCSDCKQLYEENKIAFLTQEDDSVGAYEAAGAAANGGLTGDEEEEAALGSFLGDMDRYAFSILVDFEENFLNDLFNHI